MVLIVSIVGLALIVVILFDGFEAMVLPRRVTRRIRPARLFYRSSWQVFRRLAMMLPAGKRRDNFLSVFGPLSLLWLFALWVFTLIVGFALVHLGLATKFAAAAAGREGPAGYLYLSGETFFTLGYGDVTAADRLGRGLTVVEAGIGFGFMALIIGYLPVLYQAFSRREQSIALLDARAGSPPTAVEYLSRSSGSRQLSTIDQHLQEWERWAADLLEGHLSFPVLSFYRSQHDNQSWLAALATILDTSAVLLVVGDESLKHNAQLAFAMARHAVVDLSLVFSLPPTKPEHPRLTSNEFARLLTHVSVSESGQSASAVEAHLGQLRDLYEPFLTSLGRFFLLTVPRFVPHKPTVDNWQTSAWTKRTPGIGRLQMAPGDEHFD
jgi:hypothetical protein